MGSRRVKPPSGHLRLSSRPRISIFASPWARSRTCRLDGPNRNYHHVSGGCSRGLGSGFRFASSVDRRQFQRLLPSAHIPHTGRTRQNPVSSVVPSSENASTLARSSSGSSVSTGSPVSTSIRSAPFIRSVRFVPIIHAPSRISRLHLNMRQHVKLCGLLKRPTVTYSCIERYVRALSCASYSGAQP